MKDYHIFAETVDFDSDDLGFDTRVFEEMRPNDDEKLKKQKTRKSKKEFQLKINYFSNFIF